MTSNTDVMQVLIVASERTIRESSRAWLEGAGYAVRTAADLPGAMDLLANRRLERIPDVVVVDVGLLQADGPGFGEKMHELDEHIPLIAIDAEPNAATGSDARHPGAYDTIARPIAQGRLIDVVERAAERKRLLDEGQDLRAENRAVMERLREESAQRTADLERRNRELETLTRIGREVSATLDVPQVLRRVAQLAAAVCGADRCTIVLIGEDGEILMPAASAFDDGHRDEEMWRLFKDKTFPAPLSEIPEVQQAIRERRPLFIADAERSSLPRRLIEPFDIKSVLLVPLVSKKWVIGLMALDHIEEGQRFTTQQIDMATSIAAQATLAIENARLYRQASRRARHGEMLNVVARQANTIVDPERLLSSVARTIHEHFRYDSVIIMLIDAEAGDLIIGGKAGIGAEVVPDYYRQSLDQGMIGWAARHGECLLSNDAHKEERYFAPFPDRYRAGSELAVPLKIEDQVVGVLDLQCRETGGFDERDIATASTLAEQIAIALQNAHLYQRLQRHRDELSQAYDELKEIDRLRTELVQNVSHELRIPFTLVQGYVELLMAGDLGPVSENQREALTVVRKHLDALQRRTRDLTTLDRLSREAPASRPTSMLDAVRRALSDLESQARRAGVHLSSNLPDALPPVMADGDHLEQAFTHLIENAIKFSPDGGTVRIRAWEDDDRSYVVVEDEGIGIRQEYLGQVFDRFFQVDGSINRRFGGMGIGLALVWEIAEAHGGRVEVRSQPRTGSTFVVSFPQAPSASSKDGVEIADAAKAGGAEAVQKAGRSR